MARCKNPRCSRQAKLLATAPEEIWGEDDGARVCVQCYLAFTHGTRRHPGEITFTRLPGTDLSDDDIEEIVGAY